MLTLSRGGNRKKYRNRKNKQADKKEKNKQTNKQKITTTRKKTTKKTKQVLNVIKIGICALKLDGELYRVSLEILLHAFLT